MAPLSSLDQLLKGRETVFWWSVAAAATASVATGVYYATKSTYETYVPIQVLLTQRQCQHLAYGSDAAAST